MSRLSLLPVLLFAFACGDADPVSAPEAPEVAPAAAPEATPTPETPAAAPEAPVTKPPSDATGPVRQTWERLLASGCDLAKVPVWTPVEARVLRNTPFALGGYRFKDMNLQLLYKADGGWYSPSVDAPPELDAATQACVDALKAHETKLRAAMPIPKEMEARMTRDHALFGVLRQWGETPKSPYADPSFVEDDDGTWMFFSRDPECEPIPEADCPGYSVSCPPETPCEPVAAG